MTKVRSAKAKGSCFEYDCHASLLQKYPNAYLTKQRGFQLMYDIQNDADNQVFECKRLKGISWNQLIGFYFKLHECRPLDYVCYILFKSNHQPCLVFDGLNIRTFEDAFHVPFIKHEPVKKNRNIEKKNESQRN